MFCSICGNQVTGGGFCSKCGTQAPNAPQQDNQAPAPVEFQPQQQPVQPPVQQYVQPPPQQYVQPPQQPVQQYAPPPVQQPYQGGYQHPQAVKLPHYAQGGFAEMMHSFGGSVVFLVAIILFSAGNLLERFMNFSIWSVFDLAIIALPITGFWLIFAASKAPKLPEKTLPALTLFKVSIIITLVTVSLAALGGIIGAIALFVAASAATSYIGSGGGGVAAIGFVVLLIAGGAVTFIIIYFKAVLQMIGGIRNNIMYNTFNPLPGIKTFSILTYIMVGFSVLGAIITAIIVSSTSYFIYEILSAVPDFLRDIVISTILPSSSVVAFQTLCTLMIGAGTIMCIVVLNQFSDRIISRSYGR